MKDTEEINEELNKYKESFRFLFENQLSAYALHKIIVDKSGKPVDYEYVDVNPMFEKLLGFKRSDVLGKRVTNLIPGIEKDPVDWIGKYGDVALSGKVLRFENYSKELKKWFLVSVYSPKKGYFVTIFDDITERKKFDIELNKSKEGLRSMLNSMDDIVFRFDKNLKIVFCHAPRGKLHVSPKKFLGKKYTDIKPVFPDEVVKLHGEAFSQNKLGKKYSFEYSLKIQNEVFWFSAKVSPILLDGEYNGSVEVIRDITNGKNILKGYKRYKIGFDNSVNSEFLISYKNEQPKIIHVNKGFEKLYGYSEEEVLGKNPKLINSGKTPLEYYENMWKDILNPEVGFWQNEITNKNKKGEFVDVILTISTLFDRNKNPISFTSSHVDITERKKNEEALKASESRLSTLIDNSVEIVYSCLNDKNWTMLFLNKACLDVTGYSPEEIINNNKISYSNIILLKDRKFVWDVVQRKLKEKKQFKIEYRIKTKSGKEKWVWEQGKGIFSKKGRLIRIEGTITDITKRKNLEVGIQNKYEKMFNTSPVGIIITNLKGEILDANNSYLEMFKFKSLEEVKGLGIKIFYDDISKRSEIIEELKKTGFVHNFELIWKDKIGNKRVIVFNSFLEKDIIYGMVVDITERKLIEQELMNANKELKSLDVAKTNFMNMVSHELKTPLTAMMAHIEILDDNNKSCIDKNKSSCFESMGAIKRNNNQLRFLIDNLLEISRMQSKTLELNQIVVNVRDVVFEVVNNLNAFAAQKGLKIYFKVNKNLSIVVDKDRLREILNNLVNNAIKFTDKGSVRVNVTKEGLFVVIRVIDTGIGIKKEDFPYLFKKFFQIKAQKNNGSNKGTGLGLHIVRELTEIQGGKVFLKSEVGKGSTFIIKLPIKGVPKKIIAKPIVKSVRGKVVPVKKKIVNMKGRLKNSQSDFSKNKNMKGRLKNSQSNNIVKTNSLKGRSKNSQSNNIVKINSMKGRSKNSQSNNIVKTNSMKGRSKNSQSNNIVKTNSLKGRSKNSQSNNIVKTNSLKGRLENSQSDFSKNKNMKGGIN